MRVLSGKLAVLSLIAVAMMTGCGDQGKATGKSSKVIIPDYFELDFDELFDWKKPSTLTPSLLESKSDALAIVPREKLCRAIQVGSQSAHSFSLQHTPVHNPVYSIFKSEIHPNYAAVVWQGQAMDHFYCVYPAEKDQEVPPQLLADITASLGTAHTFNGLLKQFEWELEHYLVSAKYSTSVGKGDPSFLVKVRNKAVQPLAEDRPYQISGTSPAPQARSAGAASAIPLIIDLDEVFDWDHVGDTKQQAFDAKLDAVERSAGFRLFRRNPGAGNSQVRFFQPDPMARSVKFTFYGGQYHVVNLAGYVSFEPDESLRQVELTIKTPDGKDPDPVPTIAAFDKKFGVPHTVQGNIFHIWDTPQFSAIFFKYPQMPGYCFRLMPPKIGQLPAQSRSLASSTSSSGSGVTAPMAAANRSKDFKLRLAQVNGLLISPLASGEEAGMVTKMTLSAAFNLGERGSVLRFNQDVGGDMRQSLNEVFKLASHRHPDLPLGHTIEIGFEDKYIDKDGPSAAVACALLVESAITGKTWDPLFAVTGDLNADGSVQPIGGVRAKIRGATKGSCKLVAVPAKNEKAVADTLLLDGPGPLVGITVFGIKTFDDAMRLAHPERPEALTRALADFDAMRTVIQRDPRQATALLRTPHAVQRLQALYAAAPDCYSAKYLLGYAQGRVARTLSLGGSIEAAQNSAQAILYAVKTDAATAVNKLKPDEVGNALSKLRSLRPSMDQRVWPFVDGVTDLGEVLRGAILNPVRSGARFQDLMRKVEKSASSAESAMSLLMNSAEVREELGS